ncbi:MAG TPA: hypothetical protein VIQ31_34075, partial [Phormidium sp.]
MIVILEPHGQLGNRLQLCANVIAYATEHKQTVLLLSLPEYSSYFKGTVKTIWTSSNGTKIIVPHPKLCLVFRKLIKAFLKAYKLKQGLNKLIQIKGLREGINIYSMLTERPPGIILSEIKLEKFTEEKK